jgi:hypothetical protein
MSRRIRLRLERQSRLLRALTHLRAERDLHLICRLLAEADRRRPPMMRPAI